MLRLGDDGSSPKMGGDEAQEEAGVDVGPVRVRCLTSKWNERIKGLKQLHSLVETNAHFSS